MTDKRAAAGKAWIFGGLAVVAVAGALAFLLPLGGLKAQVERDASATLGARVSIGTLRIDRDAYTITAENIRIGNAPGFRAPQSMTIAQVSAKVEDFDAPELTISNAAITGGTVTLEVGANDTNIWHMRKAMNREALSEGPRMIVRRLDVANVALEPLALPDGTTGTVIGLPDMARQDIGLRRGGLSPSEMLSVVFDEMVRAATLAADDAGYLEHMAPPARQQMMEELGLPTGLLDRAAGIVKRDFRNMGQSLQKLMEQPDPATAQPVPQSAPAPQN